MSVLLITHDLAVVAETSDRVVVLYQGRVVESGPTRAIFEAPAHPYTQRLVRSILRADRRVGAARGEGVGGGAMTEGTRCCASRTCASEFRTHGDVVRAVDGVSFEVHPGETLALVGESGCGKSTTARCIVRLRTPPSGRILFRDEDIAALSRRRFRPLRRDIQMVFQDPHASLNPSMTVRQTLREPLKLHGVDGPRGHGGAAARADGARAPRPGLLGRRADQLSGGQKQRVGIARAIATRPGVRRARRADVGAGHVAARWRCSSCWPSSSASSA